MPTSRRRSAAAVAALALAAGLVASTPATAADHPSRGPGKAPVPAGRYVAMGDSFVSGPGIERQLDPCGRSDRNFVRLVAADLGFRAFTDASCGAATTKNYSSPQTMGDYVNPPQLDALTRDTTLVTLGTMGGNDVGLVGLATTCIVRGCSTLPPEPYQAAIDALVPVYRQVIREVRRRAPRADIVAVGYGTYVPRETCAALGNATAADLEYLQGMIDRLSDTIGKVAKEQRIAFVDMRLVKGWREHTACADPADQWVRGLNGYGDGIALHPSTAGMVQMANQTLKTVRPIVTARRAAERRVASAAASVRVRAVCHGPRRNPRVTIRTTGGHGLIAAARFRVGRQWVGADQRAPFAVTRSARSLRTARAKGPVRATAMVRSGKVVRVAKATTKRPWCLR
ncbi:SGNH/GDSL hydrolase family protein [Aeromicrobium duanguangcaii]|uniref:SGNH/GDSL hydrolase family protein n=1 Tax=Aeromicrobium duanguangcaii TaxID=2968086 RepID=A0ABY5KB61_9ACTN|nr:SGNH/GDSL hydrolase family protein [Aeromicrobium duanguangcaii]MCD9155047.1 SGNH/GDSL hydrolase family protein [Aeromicrobium duanguangcaii]UUI67550.1 SGNH/GDSL hydrolase family protein [Aeromicrobium duanguangcaii]